jgi:hypothetical protein
MDSPVTRRAIRPVRQTAGRLVALRADIGKQPAIDMAKPTHTTRRMVRSFTARLRFARPIRMDES